MMPTDKDLNLLIETDKAHIQEFIETYKSSFRQHGISAADLEELATYPFNDQALQIFAYVFAKSIDWREYDEEIVRLLGESIPETVEVENTDDGLKVTYDGDVYPIKLSFSPQDRYITIRGFAAIIKDRYEPRLITGSYMSDTHDIIVLPNEKWQELQRKYPEQLKSMFMVIHDTLDFP
ncbi:hypothetical protein [Paenibacillus agricola]|uniref:Uncharacterized protein n=1 Tax=Paenibacillus agricola TaxID=2716264 RepID=A0ABX0JFB5_9BACL|nr:hypothetical protein [Paenibacillus agricola]NHN34461.1 hypothetical protein [Paenibacillus agricola]